LGYENWQAPPNLELAARAQPSAFPLESSPSLRTRLPLVVVLGLASWALVFGGLQAVFWAFEALGLG
jgi:hypothetical protein